MVLSHGSSPRPLPRPPSSSSLEGFSTSTNLRIVALVLFMCAAFCFAFAEYLTAGSGGSGRSSTPKTNQVPAVDRMNDDDNVLLRNAYAKEKNKLSKGQLAWLEEVDG